MTLLCQMQREFMFGFSKTSRSTDALMRLGTNFFRPLIAVVLPVILASCASERLDAPDGSASGQMPISLSGEISQVYQTRVSDGDSRMGTESGCMSLIMRVKILEC